MSRKILRKANETLSGDEVEPMTVQDFQDRIDKSMEDSKNGRLIKTSDLKAKIEKWR